MGVFSTHLAFENMIASGIPTGGRRNVAEDRMTDRRLQATAEHRCICSHRLGNVSAADQAILRAVYCGADWTRSLDETIGKGPRAQLHRAFTHEVLQVLPLTTSAKSAWEKLCKLPPSDGGTLATNTRLTAYKGVLAALGCPSPFETCVDEEVKEGRARLTHLARWLRTDRRPEWSEDPSQVMAQLRIVLGQRKPDHAATLSKAREAVSAALRGPEDRGVSVVLKREVGKRPPATVQIYLASLSRAGSKQAKEQMARIAIEAGKMLKGAQKAAGIVATPHHRPEKADKPRARRDIRSMADAL